MNNNIFHIDEHRKNAAKRAILLARVSTKEQEEGYSIAAQKHRLQQYCERKGFESSAPSNWSNLQPWAIAKTLWRC